jgi:hypothetical protein
VIDYDDALPPESLKAARQTLARLYPLDLPIVGVGRCADCEKTRVLVELGRVEVCGSCAEHRRKAGERVAA